MIYSPYIINLYRMVNMPKSSNLHWQANMKRVGSRMLVFNQNLHLVKQSGLGMVNNTNFHPWIAVANIILNDFGGANIFHTNLSLPPRIQAYLQNIPLFYKDLYQHMVETFTKYLPRFGICSFSNYLE